MRDLNTQTEFRSAPAQYQRSIQWLRFIGKLAIKTYFSGPEGKLNEAVDGLLKVVDRTVYTPDKLPELPMRQIFGRQRVPEV